VGIGQYAEYKGWWSAPGKQILLKTGRRQERSPREKPPLTRKSRSSVFDKTRKIIQNSALPIRNVKQEIVGAIIVNQDITERKRTEITLKESENSSTPIVATADGTRAGKKTRRHDIHDSLGSLLTAIKFGVERVMQQLRKGGLQTEDDTLRSIVSMIQEAAAEVRRIGEDLGDRRCLTTWGYCQRSAGFAGSFRASSKASGSSRTSG